MDKMNILKKGLTRRHIMFIALGSAIGTGLFMGSGSAIRLAGPAVLVAYCIAGLAAFMVMRALGEMALHNPLPGSFGRYAGSYISPLAGFMTGWSYVFEMALVCVADITAFSAYMGFWYPEVAPWIWALGITLIIIAINLFAVRAYGELEFWLSLVKVAAIIGLIIAGAALIIFGFGSAQAQFPMTFSNLWTHGGWFATGGWGFVAAFSVVVFAFGGIEIIGLTAAEAQNAEKAIPKAINTIPFRILLFYVLALAVLMSMYPWDELIKIKDESPFVIIFEHQGLHYAAHIFNFVVITAAVSAVNSDIYGAGRMMHGLAQEGQAFKPLVRLSKAGVPTVAVLVILPVLLLGVVLNFYWHDQLFFLVAAMATFATVFVWLMILLSQFCMRLKMSRQERASLKYPVPFWPAGPLLAILFMIFVIGLLGVIEETRPALYVGAVWVAWLAVCYGAIKYLDKDGRLVLKKAVVEEIQPLEEEDHWTLRNGEI